MKPENVTVNPESRASVQFTPEIISALAAKGLEIKYLVMTHNLSPEVGEPSIVIEYILIAHDAIKLCMSREKVLSLALDAPPRRIDPEAERFAIYIGPGQIHIEDTQPMIDPEVEHPDDYDFRDFPLSRD